MSTLPEWIATADRLPPECSPVVVARGRYVTTCSLRRGWGRNRAKVYWEGCSRVGLDYYDHWMPLPGPPETNPPGELEPPPMPPRIHCPARGHAGGNVTAPAPLNTVAGVSFPPVTCRRIQPGDRQPFEWWDAEAGRWARGEDVPASIRRLAPACEVERWNNHWWDYLVGRVEESR